MHRLRNAFYFWPLAATVFLSDCATKAVAERGLLPGQIGHSAGSDLVRFTLVYNQSAAMSIDLGPFSRPLLSLFSTMALIAIWAYYRSLNRQAVDSVMALALIWAGAAGNLWDRVRSHRGVVDFIDVGLGSSRFWVFNVADVAICIGAVWLALSLVRPDYRVKG